VKGITPAQTVGPFLSLGLAWPDGPHAVDPATPGALRIGGRLFDGNGDPVGDGLLETWQVAPAIRGFGRCLTDGTGAWEIITLKPGALETAEGEMEAPHLDVSVFARGLLHRLVTRIYFADEDTANAADPVLQDLPADRRGTLIAEPIEAGYRLDIYLQGPNETAFFAL
jgi:protocatechuate 3,4-dioxygenase, alpha subunit